MEASATALSRIEYLKKYINNTKEEEKKKKKKLKKSKKPQSSASMGVLVVDEDAVWQKPVKIEEEDDNEDDSADEEKPQIEEDIEVKRLKRLELIRSRQAIKSEDGSGWVTVSDVRSNPLPDSDLSPVRGAHSQISERSDSPDISPPRRNRPSSVKAEPLCEDMSPPRRSLPLSKKTDDLSEDISPPRRNRPHLQRNDDLVEDISPPRRNRPNAQRSYASNEDMSPTRRNRPHAQRLDASTEDMSPPRRQHSHSQRVDDLVDDISPPRRHCPHSQRMDASVEDLSPPRKGKKLQMSKSSDLSPPRKVSRVTPSDLSPPRKSKSNSKEEARTGLLTAQEIKKEIERKKKEELTWYKELDPSVSGRGAEPIFRDKAGNQMSKDEVLKSQKGEEKPKEKELVWGKGLTQMREAEAKKQAIEHERNQPFARTRDDPELDTMLKERVRWGDPMAHLVKPKHSDLILEDFSQDERMKESGFIIPQNIPNHSWIKRKIEAPPNRYGIKPGRHWDGVDRSNGFEKESFKRTNEKQATEREAYLWSVADM